MYSEEEKTSLSSLSPTDCGWCGQGARRMAVFLLLLLERMLVTSILPRVHVAASSWYLIPLPLSLLTRTCNRKYLYGLLWKCEADLKALSRSNRHEPSLCHRCVSLPSAPAKEVFSNWWWIFICDKTIVSISMKAFWLLHWIDCTCATSGIDTCSTLFYMHTTSYTITLYMHVHVLLWNCTNISISSVLPLALGASAIEWWILLSVFPVN